MKVIKFKYSVRTVQETHTLLVIETSKLVMHRAIIAVCCENYTDYKNALRGQISGFLSVMCGLCEAIAKF
jgi:hypothetical protein